MSIIATTGSRPALDPSPAVPFVRVASLADTAAYNAFLRQGLLAHPDTLRISPFDLDCTPFAVVESEHAATFVAGAWEGVCSLERERGRSKRKHIAWVLRMYVADGGRGVGRALLRATVRRAEQMHGITKLNLTVAAHNERAVRLYESEGFCTWGREEDAFRAPASGAELTMSKPLRRAQAGSEE